MSGKVLPQEAPFDRLEEKAFGFARRGFSHLPSAHREPCRWKSRFKNRVEALFSRLFSRFVALPKQFDKPDDGPAFPTQPDLSKTEHFVETRWLSVPQQRMCQWKDHESGTAAKPCFAAVKEDFLMRLGWDGSVRRFPQPLRANCARFSTVP